MVTLNNYKACIKARNIYGMKTPHHQQQKCVKRVFLQRLEEYGWNLLLKESADMKCAMYDQHVEH